jgi:hypothetical protein
VVSSFKSINTEAQMLELIFTTGQAASAMLLLYGAYLVLVPARRAPKLEDQPHFLKHSRNDA